MQQHYDWFVTCVSTGDETCKWIDLDDINYCNTSKCTFISSLKKCGNFLRIISDKFFYVYWNMHYSTKAFTALPSKDWKRPPSHPQITWIKIVLDDLVIMWYFAAFWRNKRWWWYPQAVKSVVCWPWLALHTPVVQARNDDDSAVAWLQIRPELCKLSLQASKIHFCIHKI